MNAAALLTITKDGQKVREQLIDGEVELGRGDGCVIQLEDRAISRKHALFRVIPGGLQLEKRSEFGPLLVNGSEVARAVLKQGDVVSVGPYLMSVNLLSDGNSSSAIETRVPQTSADSPIALESEVAPGIPAEAAEAKPGLLEATAVAPSGSLEIKAAEDFPALDLGNADSVDGKAKEESVRTTDSSSLALEGTSVEGLGAPLDLASFQEGAPEETPPAELTSSVAEPLDPPLAEEASSGLIQNIDPDSPTQVLKPDKVLAKLILPKGTSEISEYKLEKDEITIGRGKGCDIVLEDRKASRKHCAIRRNELSFIITDLESANGILVNGQKVKEAELTGDDRILVGDSEILFKVLSSDYAKQRSQINAIPPVEPSVSQSISRPSEAILPDPQEFLNLNKAPELGSVPPPMNGAASPARSYIPSAPLPSPFGGSPAHGVANDVLGIPGIDPLAGTKEKKLGFIEEIKTLPPHRKFIRIAIILGVLYFAFVDEDEPPKRAPIQNKVVKTQKKGSGTKNRTVADLSPEELKFVGTQHALAMTALENKEYDRAIFEVSKIFPIVSDYKTAREIARYAKDAKRILEAQLEEKRKKEEEAKLKAKIAELVDKIEKRMLKKEYANARELFPDILELDPDNARIAEWTKTIEQWEEEQRRLEMEKRVQEEINRRAWDQLNAALALRKQGRCYSAIDEFAKVGEIPSVDRRPLTRAKAGIAECREYIRSRREPVLEQAKQLEDSGSMTEAYKAYKRVTIIDPRHPAAFQGMERIRSILHLRCKTIHTEAVLAESFSDFSTAKKKFEEILTVAPEDDIYYERAQRKLKRFIATQTDSGGL